MQQIGYLTKVTHNFYQSYQLKYIKKIRIDTYFLKTFIEQC